MYISTHKIRDGKKICKEVGKYHIDYRGPSKEIQEFVFLKKNCEFNSFNNFFRKNTAFTKFL